MKSSMAALLAVLGLALLASCSRKESAAFEDLTLDEVIYGFRLGERKDDLYERSKYRLRWEKMPQPRMGYRGDIYRLSGALDGSREVDHVRASFFDGYLWELVVYLRDTGVPSLLNTKNRLERQYGARPTSPPPEIEKTYKKYQFDLPRMTVILCRFTKKPADELFIQYMHNELHRRLLERSDKQSADRTEPIRNEAR